MVASNTSITTNTAMVAMNGTNSEQLLSLVFLDLECY